MHKLSTIDKKQENKHTVQKKMVYLTLAILQTITTLYLVHISFETISNHLTTHTKTEKTKVYLKRIYIYNTGKHEPD